MFPLYYRDVSSVKREYGDGYRLLEPDVSTSAESVPGTVGSKPSVRAIEVTGLCKSFGRSRVLRDLDLQVRWDEVLTVLGPNGSGKTTLIKILATLTRPDSGTVRVAGSDTVRSGQNVRRLIGVVMHDTMMYDDLTAYENLRFAARMFALDRHGERIQEVSERMGVIDRLHQRFGTLSHGLKKRFSIAKALLPDPYILLLDEPESGLDQEALAMLEDILVNGAGRARTVVMTTHNIERGLALGDRVAIIAGGRIAYEGTLDGNSASEVREEFYRHAR